MTKSGRIIAAIAILVVVVFAIFFLIRALSEKAPAENVRIFSDEVSGISFSYPSSWGDVTRTSGNDTCPEEDTYRTADTLSVFDYEYQFPDTDLPNTESFIRSGIRVHLLDPQHIHDCGDTLLLALATGQLDGRTFSSFRLMPVETADYLVLYNPLASRLDTEGREQYTFFVPKENGTYLIVQPYYSFIPWNDSLEWKEIDSKYPGNMEIYKNEGQTAKPLREFSLQFRKMSETIQVR